MRNQRCFLISSHRLDKAFLSVIAGCVLAFFPAAAQSAGARTQGRTASVVTGTAKATGSAAVLQKDPLPAKPAASLARPAAVPAGATRAAAEKLQLQRLPLSFEPNEGQTNKQVDFLAHGLGYALFLTSHEAVLELKSPAGKRGTVVRMKLLGSNSQAARMSGQDKFPGKINYLIGRDPSKWHTNIPTYAKVIERGVYPGVDLVYYGHQQQLEYDFVVGAHAKVDAIRLQVDGARKLQLDSKGNLVVTVPGGEVTFRKPVAYQQVGAARRPVKAGYVMNGSNVAFRVGRYDSSAPLVIDPILAYSTYLGGSNIDGANAIAVLSTDGTAFVTGGTFSIDFPTEHPLQPNAGGSNDFSTDAFVAKLSADGGTVLYATYLGGSREDIGNGIAVDSLGEAYVTGTTLSDDFPVTPGAFDPNCPPDGKCGASVNTNGLIWSAGFLSKLNAAGSALDYSTYFGGQGNTQGEAVAVDNNQNAYVTGSTEASDFPYIVPQCLTFVGPQNAFLLKLDSTGSRALYSGTVGGNVQDSGLAVAVDGSGNASITGITYSANFPVTANALQSTYGLSGDAFVTTLNTSFCGAPSISYSSFLGGSGLDQGDGVAVDSSGKVYVTGLTKSTNFPTTSGAYQTSCKLDSQNVCDGDAFVTKLDTSVPAGTNSLLFSTYLGGTGGDRGNGIAVDPSDNVYITGSTNSTDFPLTTAVFQSSYGGGNSDAFITKLIPAGTALSYSSYLGGTNTDSGNGIAVDTSGAAYVAGQTCSSDFPLSNPAQLSPGGNCDAFISKVIVSAGIALSPAGLTFAPQLVNTMSAPKTITLDNGDAPLTITSISVTGTDSGDFTQTNDCGTSQPPGGVCTISVTFMPTASGIRNADITIVDSAPGSPHVASLTGTGNPTGILTLLPTSLSFGNQPVGSPSSPESIKVTNTGNAALTISTIVASGDYSETNNCTSAPLQPTTNCSIQVTFKPSMSGSSTGALTITDNAPGSPQVVLLTGTGVLQPVVTLSANSLDFGNQAVGTSSAAKQVTLSNTGSGVLDVSGMVANGDFSVNSTCGSSVAINGTCTISIVFTPSAGGPRTGNVTITDNAPDSPQVIALSGGGSDFSLSSSTPSATTFAGTPVQYSVTVTPTTGFDAAVALSCQLPSGLSGATCSVLPSSVTPDGTDPVQATVTVKTTARTLTPPGPIVNLPPSQSPGLPVFWLAAVLAAALLAVFAARRRRILLSFGLVALAAVMCAGCGSGRSYSGSGTAAGTYTVTINGTSGSAVHSTTVKLTVN